MSTFWIIILSIFVVIQLAGMIWAEQHLRNDKHGDSSPSIGQYLFFTVFWPITWFASLLEGLE